MNRIIVEENKNIKTKLREIKEKVAIYDTNMNEYALATCDCQNTENQIIVCSKCKLLKETLMISAFIYEKVLPQNE